MIDSYNTGSEDPSTMSKDPSAIDEGVGMSQPPNLPSPEAIGLANKPMSMGTY